MLNLRLKIVAVLVCILLMAFVSVAWAVEYNPGVSTGQWVKYGNFVVVGSGVSSELNDTDWVKVEVVAVSGKNVTLHTSGKYKNGTDYPEGDMIVNVETGAINGTTIGGVEIALPLIAANLAENDAITRNSLYKISKTETRTYMGVSRTVNILNFTMSALGYGFTYIVMWDKASGMLLEVEATTETPQTTSKMSFSAIDTNIFATGTLGLLMENIIYIVITIIILVAVIAAIVIMRKKKTATT